MQVGLPPAAAAGLAGLNGTNGGCAVANGRAGTYFVEYPEDIKLWGLSVNTAGPAGIALQGEYSYRSNQPLQLPSAELLLAALGQGNLLTSTTPLVAGAVPYGTEISGYRRVKMHQLQATRPRRSARHSTPSSWLWSARSATRISICREISAADRGRLPQSEKFMWSRPSVTSIASSQEDGAMLLFQGQTADSFTKRAQAGVVFVQDAPTIYFKIRLSELITQAKGELT